VLAPDPPYRPVRYHDGYLAQEDLGLIGDGSTAALIGLDGNVVWLCVPRFDSDAALCALLDRERGGRFRIAPRDGIVAARQRYEPDTAVLVTEMRSPTGLLRVTDALVIRPGDLSEEQTAARGELVRSAVVLEGSVDLEVELRPRWPAQVQPAADGLVLEPEGGSHPPLHLRANKPLDRAAGVFSLSAGERLHLVLSWGEAGVHRYRRFGPEALLDRTASAWRHWMRSFSYAGPEELMVRRAAITLKLCDYWASGSLVAAPTSSLPAPVGGERNWDYRYTWVRDAAYSVWAFRRIGFTSEANAFLGWVLDAFERSGEPRIMYNVAGGPVPAEHADPVLEGYRRSAPVRWGNGARSQLQHDVYGEVLDVAWQWGSHGQVVDETLWSRLSQLAEQASEVWRTPDQGIWEVRSSGRVFTFSVAMCQVALDRAARLGESLGLPGPLDRWRASADKLVEKVLRDAWDEARQSLCEHLGGGGLDASLLALPLRRVIPADHPRMVATTAAVQRHLGAGDGLLYRYLHDESPDGIPGGEGAFLLCSFWLVDNLALQGRVDEALELYSSLCERASPLGLLPEQIDPSTGAFVGNFPQAFSHVGVISSGANLARAARR
jgi:GH15 family glucan-1,4-alpha-glucosidase